MNLPDALQSAQSSVISLCLLILTILLPVLIRHYGGDARDAIQAWIAQVDAKLDDRQRALVKEGVKIAVQAAEQAGLSGIVKDKKAWALDFAENWLAGQGVMGLDLHQLDALVESEVFELFGWENKDKVRAATVEAAASAEKEKVRADSKEIMLELVKQLKPVDVTEAKPE